MHLHVMIIEDTYRIYPFQMKCNEWLSSVKVLTLVAWQTAHNLVEVFSYPPKQNRNFA